MASHDIQVEEEFQRKGLGKHLMQVCELIGTKQRMKFVQLLLPNGSERAVNFLTSKMKGYDVDHSHHEFLEGDVEDEGFGIYGKCIDRALKAKKQAEAAGNTVFDPHGEGEKQFLGVHIRRPKGGRS